MDPRAKLIMGLVGLPGVLELLRRERDNPTLPTEQRDQVLALYAEARHLAPAPPTSNPVATQVPEAWSLGGSVWGAICKPCADKGAKLPPVGS